MLAVRSTSCSYIEFSHGTLVHIVPVCVFSPAAAHTLFGKCCEHVSEPFHDGSIDTGCSPGFTHVTVLSNCMHLRSPQNPSSGTLTDAASINTPVPENHTFVLVRTPNCGPFPSAQKYYWTVGVASVAGEHRHAAGASDSQAMAAVQYLRACHTCLQQCSRYTLKRRGS